MIRHLVVLAAVAGLSLLLPGTQVRPATMTYAGDAPQRLSVSLGGQVLVAELTRIKRLDPTTLLLDADGDNHLVPTAATPGGGFVTAGGAGRRRKIIQVWEADATSRTRPLKRARQS